MDPNKIAEELPSTAEVTEEKVPQVPSQKIQRTEKEKAAFSLRKNAERLAELGGDPADVLGLRRDLHIEDGLSDDTPVTVGKLREIQKHDAHKTALKMADDIEDEHEKTRVKDILSTRIVPSGNAEEDLRLARNAVTAERAMQLALEQGRKNEARKTAPGGSADAPIQEEFVPTAEEQQFMRPPYNMTKEQILAKRKK